MCIKPLVTKLGRNNSVAHFSTKVASFFSGSGNADFSGTTFFAPKTEKKIRRETKKKLMLKGFLKMLSPTGLSRIDDDSDSWKSSTKSSWLQAKVSIDPGTVATCCKPNSGPVLFRWIWSTGRSGSNQTMNKATSSRRGTCANVLLLSHYTRAPRMPEKRGQNRRLRIVRSRVRIPQEDVWLFHPQSRNNVL